MLRAALAVALILAFAVPTLATEGANLTPDELAVLVSADVGQERWAITLSLSEASPLTVTGNVYRGAGEPAFIYCAIVDVMGDPNDIAHAQFTWNCYGNDACRPGNCKPWEFISDVTLPGSFFLPR